MPKTIIALVVLLLLTSSAAFYGFREAGRYDGLYETEKGLRVAAEARLKRIQTNVPLVDKKNEELRYALDESLRLNREWADRPVPDSVSDSLCARANCARVQPLPSPAD